MPQLVLAFFAGWFLRTAFAAYLEDRMRGVLILIGAVVMLGMAVAVHLNDRRKE